MGLLTSTQLNSLNRAILAIYEAESFAQLPQAAFAAVRELVPHQACGFAEVNRQARWLNGSFSDPEVFSILAKAPPEALTSFFDFASVQDGSYYSLRDITCVTDRESRQRFEHSEFYQSFYRPMGLYFDGAINFYETSTTTTMLCVARPDHTFDANERELLRMLQPHLRQRYLQLLAAEPGHPVFGQAMALQAQDWLLCTTGGEIVEHSPGAWAALLQQGIRTVGRIPQAWREWLVTHLRPFAPERRPSGPLIVQGETARMTVYCIVNRFNGVHRLILLRRPHRFKPLSKRECEVAHWVAEGKSNAVVAQMLGISEATVKNHVVSILTKIGGENRASIATHYWREIYTEAT